jgi:hypothetical protein
MRTIQESVDAIDAVLSEPKGSLGYYNSPFLSKGIFTCKYDPRSDTTFARVRIYRNGFGFSVSGMHRASLFDFLSRKVEAYGKLYAARQQALELVRKARAELDSVA